MAQDEALVWCDVRKNIGVVQLVLGLKEQHVDQKRLQTCVESGSSEITVSSHSVVVKKTQSSGQTDSENDRSVDGLPQDIHVSFKDIKVIPMSCNGLSLVWDSEVQMRLQINTDENPHSQGDGFDEERQGLRKGPVTITCRMCGNIIIQKRQFDRVLELPSQHWQQTSQNLCCHGTVSNLSSLQDGSLHPGEKDCLLGGYFIMVHPSAVEAKHLVIIQGEMVIKCQRCSKAIGDINIQNDGTGESQVKGIRINKHAITMHGTNVFSHYTTEVFLSSLLSSKLEGRVSFKFLVKAPLENGSSKPYALLWILNADAAVITNISPPTNKHEQNNQTTDTTQAKFTNGMKILYKILIKCTKKEVKKMKGRGNLDILSLSQETCLHLLLLLTRSTYAIPPSLRQVEGFTVGYLRS